MKHRKLKKQVWIVLIAVILLCVFAGSKLLFNNKEEKTASGSSGSAIENQGVIEIIVPEDMESEGF